MRSKAASKVSISGALPYSFSGISSLSQDINQLKSRETGYGPDETITSNCHVQAAFPPNRLETAEHLQS